MFEFLGLKKLGVAKKVSPEKKDFDAVPDCLDLDIDHALADRRELEGKLVDSRWLFDFSWAMSRLVGQPETVKILLGRIIERLKNETRIAEELGELFDLSLLTNLDGFFQKNSNIKLVREVSSRGETKWAGSASVDGAVQVLQSLKPKDFYAIWMDFCTKGLPDIVDTLAHENLHIKQIHEPYKKGWAGFKEAVLDPVVIPIFRLEGELFVSIHFSKLFGDFGALALFMIFGGFGAYELNRARQRSKSRGSSEKKRLIAGQSQIVEPPAYILSGLLVESRASWLRLTSHVEVLKKEYHLEETLVPEIIATALEVRRLRLLQMSHAQIAELMQHAVWDQKTGTHPFLQKEIDRLCAERGVDVEDLDTAMDVRRVTARNDQLRVQLIAREELQNFVREVRRAEDSSNVTLNWGDTGLNY